MMYHQIHDLDRKINAAQKRDLKSFFKKTKEMEDRINSSFDDKIKREIEEIRK